MEWKGKVHLVAECRRRRDSTKREAAVAESSVIAARKKATRRGRGKRRSSRSWKIEGDGRRGELMSGGDPPASLSLRKLLDIHYPYSNYPNPRYPILISDTDFDYPKLV